MSLIERIVSKFSSPAATEAVPTAQNATIPPNQAQPAAPSSAEILTRLRSSRQLLEVQIDNRESSFQSMIVAVDIDRGLLWLDQLVPATISLSEGQWLTLRHQRLDKVLTLKVPVISDQSRSRGAIAVLLPDQAYYQPRRSWHRYQPDGSALRANVRTIGEDPTQAKVLNVSGGGLRIALKGNQLRQYRRDAHLPLCQFQLSDHFKINCQARVKSARLVREPFRHTQVSLEFTDIAHSTCLQLDRLLKLLEGNLALDQTSEQMDVNNLQLVG